MRDHGALIELRGDTRRGQRACRLASCPKCGTDAPHEYVCLQGKGPRVWGYVCTQCRRQRQELEAESC